MSIFSHNFKGIQNRRDAKKYYKIVVNEGKKNCKVRTGVLSYYKLYMQANAKLGKR